MESEIKKKLNYIKSNMEVVDKYSTLYLCKMLLLFILNCITITVKAKILNEGTGTFLGG